MKNIVVKKIEELKANEDLLNLEYSSFDIILDDVEGLDDEDAISVLKDIACYGCSSGCVGALIYYRQTERFFKEHSSDILYLLDAYQNDIGEKVSFEINENNLTWFAFESVVYRLCNELELEF